MFDCPRHPANSESVLLGDAARLVLDGLTLKIRAKSAATPWPKTFPKKTGAEAPAKFSREVAHDGRRFALAGVNGRGGRVRE